MHLIYIDDSFEKPCQTFSAIAIPANEWRNCFAALKLWRLNLKASDGILLRREFHATEFVAGRGRLGPGVVTKHRRSQIFFSAFDVVASLPGAKVFAVCRMTKPEWAFERLITRIHKTMDSWDSYAVLVCDEGKEDYYTKLVRRMGKYNPVPVYVGQFPDYYLKVQNLAVVRILEDPVFKASDRSYFIQMADFVAYGLLRKEQRLASKDRYGLHKAFERLKPVMVAASAPKDPFNVIR